MNEQDPNFVPAGQPPNAGQQPNTGRQQSYVPPNQQVPANQQAFMNQQQPIPAKMQPEHPHAASMYGMPQQQMPAGAVAGAGEAVTEEAPRVAIPSTDDLRAELRRSSTKSRVRNVTRNALFAIIAVAAIAVLISMLFMPVLRIFGNSMTPTLKEGTVAVAMKNASLEEGDIVAFYYNNKVLVKRVIATPGSWVDITDDGVVSVDGRTLDEPYVNELALGECDIDLPYQVPDNRYFVMGDHRSTSIDSRSTTLGCISNDQLVGKVLATVWPLNEVGLVS